MSDEKKLECIAESMDMEMDELSRDQVLDELENWDSVAVLFVISFINENFGKYPNAGEILENKTVQDLMDAMK